MNSIKIIHGMRWRLTLIPLLAGGCAPTLKPIFPPVEPPIAWPPAPVPARVRFVGTLRGAEDLKAPRSALQGLARLFVGREAPAPLYGPRSVMCTADGQRIWVADVGGRCVHMLDLQRRRYLRIQRVAGSPLLTPVAVAPGPDGSLYVCDSEDVAIHRLSDRTGALLATLRLPEDILRPAALAYVPDGEGMLLVVDAAGHDIKALTADGMLLGIIGRHGDGAGEFNFPCDITFDGSLIWVADAGNQRVQALTLDGTPVTSIGQVGDAPGDMALPKSVAVDSEGHVYVVDARFENVQVFDREGRLLLFFGEEGSGPGQFWLPADIFIDAMDRLWICDTFNRRVQLFEYVRATP